MPKKVLKPFVNEPPCPTARRFLAFLIDVLLIVVVHTATFLGFSSIMGQTDFYKTNQSQLESCMLECYKIQEQAHIYEYKGEGKEKYENPKTQEEMYKKWINMHVLKAYNLDPTAFKNAGIENPTFPEEIVEATYETDNIAYFYVSFVKDYNDTYKILDFKGMTPKQYYYDVFKRNAFTYNDDALWTYDDENLSLQSLKGKYAVTLYKYLNSSTTYQDGLAIYNLTVRTWQKIWNEEVDLLISSNGYQVHYSKYLNQYKTLSIGANITSIVAYVVAFCLIYMLPVILFKTHQTLGKRFKNVLIIDDDGYYIQPGQIVLRTIIKFFGFFGFSAAGNFIASGLNSSWVYPMFKIGEIGISFMIINLFFVAIALISFAVSLFNSKKKNISDFISRTYAVDLRYFIDNKKGLQILEEEEEKYKSNCLSPDFPEVIDLNTIQKAQEEIKNLGEEENGPTEK